MFAGKLAYNFPVTVNGRAAWSLTFSCRCAVLFSPIGYNAVSERTERVEIPMKLPTRDEAIKILTENSLTPLSLDGAAHLQTEHPELWLLFEQLVAGGKIDNGVLTGVTLLVGMVLQTPGEISPPGRPRN